MHALIATGDPDNLVQLGDVDEPNPAPDQVVIQVESFSINRGETFLLEEPRPNWRPGKDVAGRVIRVAANGDGPGVGTRVVAHAEHSGWAERAAVSLDGLAVLPDIVPFDVAAALPLAGLTALRLLRVAGPIASQRILITGASGGVGHYLVELAARQGAQVTAVTSSPGRGARLLELGAAHVVREITDAEGPFDVVMESVGGDQLAAALRSVRAGGLVIWFGQASGERPVLDFFDWDIPLGVSMHRFGYQPEGASDASDLATLIRLVERGDLHPEIGLTRDWTHAHDALQALIHRQIRGNAVLTITSEPGRQDAAPALSATR
jgi:NADPH:quinone reductase-like Zn-dependent oxidoreductase